MYLICLMTSQDHFIERSYKFMDGSSLCYATMLVSLVAISIVMLEICFHLNTFLKGYMNSWMETHNGEPQLCHILWLLVQGKWRYIVVKMLHDQAKPPDGMSYASRVWCL